MTMEQAIIEILKSTPEAAAILVVVIVFLRAMASRDKAFAEQQELWNKRWSEQVSHTTSIVQANSHALGVLSAVLKSNERKS